MPFHEGTRLLTGTTLAWSWSESSFFELQVEATFGDRWVHLKHKLSLCEYKGVLSKIYGGAILLMHMYQGKGRRGSTCRSFDLASPELRVPDFEVRSVHESITYHQQITPLWCPSRLPHEKARHSTHTYLGMF